MGSGSSHLGRPISLKQNAKIAPIHHQELEPEPEQQQETSHIILVGEQQQQNADSGHKAQHENEIKSEEFGQIHDGDTPTTNRQHQLPNSNPSRKRKAISNTGDAANLQEESLNPTKSMMKPSTQQESSSSPLYKHHPIEISTIFPPPLTSLEKKNIESIISILLKNHEETLGRFLRQSEVVGFLWSEHNGKRAAAATSSTGANPADTNQRKHSTEKGPVHFLSRRKSTASSTSSLLNSVKSLIGNSPSFGLDRQKSSTRNHEAILSTGRASPRRRHSSTARSHASSMSSQYFDLFAHELFVPNKEGRTLWHYIAIVWNYLSTNCLQLLIEWTHQQLQQDQEVFQWLNLLLESKDVYGYSPLHVILYHYKASDNLSCLIRLLTEYGIFNDERFQMGILLYATPIGEPNLSKKSVKKRRIQKRERISSQPDTRDLRISSMKRRLDLGEVSSAVWTEDDMSPRSSTIGDTSPRNQHPDDNMSLLSEVLEDDFSVAGSQNHNYRTQMGSESFRSNFSATSSFRDTRSNTLRWTYKPFGGVRKAPRRDFISKYQNLYELLTKLSDRLHSKKKVQKFARTHFLPPLLERQQVQTLLNLLHGYLMEYHKSDLYVAACNNDLPQTVRLTQVSRQVCGNMSSFLIPGLPFNGSVVKKRRKPGDGAETEPPHELDIFQAHPRILVEAASQAFHLGYDAIFQQFVDACESKSILGRLHGLMSARPSLGDEKGQSSTPGKDDSVKVQNQIVEHHTNLRGNSSDKHDTHAKESHSTETNTSPMHQISKEFIENIDKLSAEWRHEVDEKNTKTHHTSRRNRPTIPSLHLGSSADESKPSTSSSTTNTDRLLLAEHRLKEHIAFLGQTLHEEEPQLCEPLQELFCRNQPVRINFDRIVFPPLHVEFKPLFTFSELQDKPDGPISISIEIDTVLDLACLYGFRHVVHCAMLQQSNGEGATEQHLMLSLASDHEDITKYLVEHEGILPGERLLLLACMIDSMETVRLCLRFTKASYSHVYVAIKNRHTEIVDHLVYDSFLFNEAIAACIELGSIRYLERYYLSDESYLQRQIYQKAPQDIQRALELRYVSIAEFLFLHEKKLHNRCHEWIIVCSCVLYDNFEALRKFMDHLLFDVQRYQEGRDATNSTAARGDAPIERASPKNGLKSQSRPMQHPLVACAESGKTHLLRFIMEHPTRIESTHTMFEQEFSILHVAAANGHQQLIQYLLEELFEDFYQVPQLVGEENLQQITRANNNRFESAEHMKVGQFLRLYICHVKRDDKTVLELAHGHRSLQEYLKGYVGGSGGDKKKTR